MTETMVSVVIPCLDSPIIGETISSVRSQAREGVRLEIVVVGRDSYGQVGEDEVVRLIRTPQPVFPGEARNLGVAAAKGAILLFLDADCVAAEGWLEQHLAHQKAGACVVGGSVDFDNDNFWTLCDNVATFYNHLPQKKREHRKFLPTVNLSLPRSALEKSGLFDPRLRTGEDLDLSARLYLAGYHLIFEPLAKVYHRPQRNSFRSYLEHHLRAGENSVSVRRTYPEVFGRWLPTGNVWLLIAASPVFAGYVSVRAFLADRSLWKYWRTFPFVFLAKLLWCKSAAEGARHPKRLLRDAVWVER